MKNRTTLQWMLLTGSALSTLTFTALNIAIVAMIKRRPINEEEARSNECHSIDTILDINHRIFVSNRFINIGSMHRSVFVWDGFEQGIVLGAVYWLTWITQPLGHWLARKYKPKLVYGLSNLSAALLFFLVPMALYFSVEWLLVVRVVQGLLLGIAFACPPIIEETLNQGLKTDGSPFNSAAWMRIGEVIALALSYPVFGLIMDAVRWDDVIYTCGWLGVAWSVCWYILVYSSPTTSSDSLENFKHSTPTPWRLLLSSGQVWVLIVTRFLFSTVTSFLIIYLPLFFGLIHGLDILTTALFTGLPHFLRLFIIWISLRADHVLSTKRPQRRVVPRKIFTLVATLIPGAALIGTVNYNFCDIHMAAAFMAVAVIVTGFASAGLESAAKDLTQSHYNAIEHITRVAGSFAAIALTIGVGVVTHENQSHPQWREIFQIVGGISIAAGAIYVIFAQCDADLERRAASYCSNSKQVELKTIGKQQQMHQRLAQQDNNNSHSMPCRNQGLTEERQPFNV